MNVVLDPETGRLPVNVVKHVHRLIGGDALGEARVLDFIAAKFRAKNLLYVPANVAGEIIRRPADFQAAAKKLCEPELKF